MAAPHPHIPALTISNAYVTLALEQLQAGQKQEAHGFLERAWRGLGSTKDTSPDRQRLRARILFYQGLIALAERDFSTAMLIFRQALLRCRRALAEDDPERAEYHNALALVARKTGRYSLALGHLQAALKHATRCAESTRTRLYRNLALLELEGNRPQAAVSAARQALELEPEAENKLLLGRCLLALAQETEAKEFLKQAAQEGDGSTRHQSASLLYCR